MRKYTKETEVWVARDGQEFEDSDECATHDTFLNINCTKKIGEIGLPIEEHTAAHTAIDCLVEDGRCESDYFRIDVLSDDKLVVVRDWMRKNSAYNDGTEKPCWKWGIENPYDVRVGKVYIVCINVDLGMFVYSMDQLLVGLTTDIHTAFYGDITAETVKE